jgi:hypothetical protein
MRADSEREVKPEGEDSGTMRVRWVQTCTGSGAGPWFSLSCMRELACMSRLGDQCRRPSQKVTSVWLFDRCDPGRLFSFFFGPGSVLVQGRSEAGGSFGYVLPGFSGVLMREGGTFERGGLLFPVSPSRPPRW